MPGWHDDHFTGLFTLFVRVQVRPHDPSVPMTAGEMPPWYPGEPELGCGGAGWTVEEADLACLGEAVERILARALPRDHFVEASWSNWPLHEPAVDPRHWVLFHPAQYAQQHFPLAPLTPDSVCRWVCCRRVRTGDPVWVPEEMVYLLPRRGESQRYMHGFSTGLTCGKVGHPVLLRGAQEVIERDALVGGWWGRYGVEEWPEDVVREILGAEIWRRVDRPNLTYRFYHFRSPFSAHVTLISLSGQDQEGWVFSVGSACRETRAASWRKALLEAIQGRHCVRRLLARWQEAGQPPLQMPTTFLEHALFYALHPMRLAETVLECPARPSPDPDAERTEGLDELCGKLGDDRPVLFRNLTPPVVTGVESSTPRCVAEFRGVEASTPATSYPSTPQFVVESGVSKPPPQPRPAPNSDWLVLRVVIPGLQPLHGDHRLPFLGGPLWQPRPCSDWASVPPHPFA